ncbi:MAG: DUF5667 domain-containing protein [Chloroflexota bacterium]
MNSHPILYEDLIAYAAGELIEDESAPIEQHLAVCPECEATVSRFRNIGVILRSDVGEIPPASAVARARNVFTQYQRTRQIRRIEEGLWSLLRIGNLSPATAILVLLVATLALYVGMGLVIGQNAGPGDFLYPIKTGFEDLRVAVTLRNSDKVKLYLDLAGVRLEEIRIQVRQQQFEKIPDTAIAYEAHVQSSSDFLSAVLSKDVIQAKPLAEMIQNTLNGYIGSLTTLSEEVPEDIKPALRHAIMISGSVVSVAVRVLNMPAIIVQSTMTPHSPGLGAPTPGATSLPVPTNTRVIPEVPTVGIPVSGKPSLPAPVRSPPTGPPTALPAVTVERCQSSAQPKPSGIISKVTMAQGFRASDGEPINPKEEFAPKDVVYAVIRIQNAPANTKFKALWCVTNAGRAALPDTKLGESELSTDRTRGIYFNSAPAGGWPVGEYRVEIYVNGVLDTTRKFRVK